MSPAPASNTVESSTTPNQRPSRRYWQFGLLTMLLVMVPLGLSFVLLRNYLENQSIEWVPYSANVLAQDLQEGRIVLVSFRASWDVNSLVNERNALERPKVKQYLGAHRIIPMQADWTEESDEIRDALGSLGQPTIPVIAIYAPSSPDDPIVLVDLVTEQQVLDALETAVANSQSKSRSGVTEK